MLIIKENKLPIIFLFIYVFFVFSTTWKISMKFMAVNHAVYA